MTGEPLNGLTEPATAEQWRPAICHRHRENLPGAGTVARSRERGTTVRSAEKEIYPERAMVSPRLSSRVSWSFSGWLQHG